MENNKLWESIVDGKVETMKNIIKEAGICVYHYADILSREELISIFDYFSTAPREDAEMGKFLKEAWARGKKDGSSVDIVSSTYFLNNIHDLLSYVPISALNLSIRASSTLESLGITNVSHLLNSKADDLVKIKNFGQTTLQEIKRSLRRYCLLSLWYSNKSQQKGT